MLGEVRYVGRMSVVFALALSGVIGKCLHAEDSPIQSKAVVKLSFDEASGPANDSATAGTVKEAGQFVNGASRVKSPFAGQKGKSALIVDGARKQSVQIPDGADVDQGNGVSVSFFYLHLGSPDDAGYQGLFAKRADANGATNYGINFTPKTDLLQLYLNDGSGFKTAQYGFKQVLSVRRPNFITATYEVGDAPGDDADTDKDDVLVRLYVNGQPQAPKAVPGVQVSGNDSWLLNLNIAGLLNDTSVTIGSSTPTIEFTSGVFDEFSIIPGALSPEDAQKLFVEVAGPNATSAVLAETLPPQAAAPAVSLLSTNGLQLGTTTSLIIQGANLQPNPTVSLPVPGSKLTIGPNSNATQVEVQVVLPAEAPVGHYAVRVQTPNGVSNALPIAVDGLPEVAANGSSAAKALTLPVAVSGLISGSQQARAWFAGKAGQMVVADIESRRLGAAMTPVIEVKTGRGTPLKIEWGHVEFNGDARAVVKLPADDNYYVEVHDLSYNGPGANPYRLKIGDLKLADVVLGGVTAGTESQLAISGRGLDPQAKQTIDLRGQTLLIPRQWPLPAALGIAAPAPRLVTGPGPEFVETPAAAGQQQTLDAKFANSPLSIGFTGVLSAARERDSVLLQVSPGQKLTLVASGNAVSSPLDPQVMVLNQANGSVVASADNAGTREASLEYTVPGDQSQILVAVTDLRARGGDNYRYRLRIAPAGQADFTLALTADRLQLPQDGSAVTQVEVRRAGYNGPVKLSVQGDPHVTIAPAVIPAGVSKGWVTLTRQAAAPSGAVTALQVIGESTEGTPALTRVAQVPPDGRLTLLAPERTSLALGLTAPAGNILELGALPPSLYRGVDVTIPVKLKVSEQARTKVARLTLMSTEAARLNNPNDANQGQKPRVDGALNQIVEVDDAASGLLITVPTDVAESGIDFVIKAELVEHPFAQNVVATVYSVPFRLPVQNAVTVALAANNLMLKSATAGKFTGTVKRTAGFTGPVSVQIVNLPAGTTATPVTVAPGEEAFEIAVTPATVTAPMDIPNVAFRVNSVENPKPLQADTPLATKIAP